MIVDKLIEIVTLFFFCLACCIHCFYSVIWKAAHYIRSLNFCINELKNTEKTHRTLGSENTKCGAFSWYFCQSKSKIKPC